MKKELRGKPIAPDWSKGRKILIHSLFKPSLWERVRILCGMNVLLSGVWFSSHSPGKVAGGIFPRITSATDPNDPELIIALKIEAEKASLEKLPTAQQFAATESLREKFDKSIKETLADTL